MADSKDFIEIGKRTLAEIEEVQEKYPMWFKNCKKGDLHAELRAYCDFIKCSALKAKWSESARQLAKNTLELLDHLERMPVQISNNTENDTTNKNSKVIIKATDINSQLIDQLVYRLGQIQPATIKKHKDAIKSILERSDSIENDWERDIEREVRKLLGGEESSEYRQLNSEPLNAIIEGIFEKQTQLERQVLQNSLQQTRAFLLALKACGAFGKIELPEQPPKKEQPFVLELMDYSTAVQSDIPEDKQPSETGIMYDPDLERDLSRLGRACALADGRQVSAQAADQTTYGNGHSSSIRKTRM